MPKNYRNKSGTYNYDLQNTTKISKKSKKKGKQTAHVRKKQAIDTL